MNSLKDIVNIIEAEGFQGAHSLVFLIKYAYLAEDRELTALINNTMEDMSSLPESPSLLEAYREWNRATGRGAEIVSFLSSRQKRGDMPWDYLELYKESFDPAYLESAIKGGEYILEHFHEMFNPDDVYDIDEPSFNSRVAVLYDELARYTQDERFIEAREKQNSFIRMLADRYPTKVAYGLIALLADEFGETTVVCEGEVPEAIASFYAPTTAVVFKPSDEIKIGIMKDGNIEPVMIK